MPCNDNDGLILVPVCPHFRQIAKPLLFNAKPDALQDLVDTLARSAGEDNAIDATARLCSIGMRFLECVREDRQEMEAIRNA
jgi:hypothetical protein